MTKNQADRIEKKLDMIIDFFSIGAKPPDKTNEEIRREVVEFLQERKDKAAGRMMVSDPGS